MIPKKHEPRKFDFVSIVGFSPLTRDDVPWENEEMEVWSMNERYKHGNIKRWDRWFQMHPYENCTRENNQNDKDHPEWLRKKHNFPIYMQSYFSDIPNSLEYPLDEVSEYLGRKYFTSGASYMLALAMYMGFTKIGIYGFDMANSTEYSRQRANFEWMLGLAQGKGIELVMPPQTKLLKDKIYGYEHIMTGYRQQLEFRGAAIEKAKSDHMNKFHEAKGKAKAYEALSATYPELKDETDKLLKEAKVLGAEVNVIQGSLNEIGYCIENFDSFERGEGNVK